MEGDFAMNANRVARPWDIRDQAEQQKQQKFVEKAPVQMTSLSNDFIFDKHSIKLVPTGEPELFLFQFNFKLKAPECSVTMFQQVFE